VNALLGIGSLTHTDEWPDYPGEFRLTSADIPELIRMMTDPALLYAEVESGEAWSPVHAWRALAQLGAAEAVEPMLGLVRDGENLKAFIEVPKVVAQIGPAALRPLTAVLSDAARDETVRVAAIRGLRALADKHPSVRRESLKALTEQLRDPRHNSLELNAFLVRALCELGAKQSAPAVERAFLQQQVDLSIITWDEVVKALGL
jgi:hypothetical protein